MIYMNERFEVVGVLAHVSNDGMTELQVFALVAIKLVRECVEETVAYKDKV